MAVEFEEEEEEFYGKPMKERHDAGQNDLLPSVEVQTKLGERFLDQVAAIAFTDCHVNKPFAGLAKDKAQWLGKRAIHYVASADSLAEPQESEFDGILPHISAGHVKHEYTTGAAWPLI